MLRSRLRFYNELREITEPHGAHLMRHCAVEQPFSECRVGRNENRRGAHRESVPHLDCWGEGAIRIERRDPPRAQIPAHYMQNTKQVSRARRRARAFVLVR